MNTLFVDVGKREKSYILVDVERRVLQHCGRGEKIKILQQESAKNSRIVCHSLERW